MQHVEVDIVFRHRDRRHDLTLAVVGGATTAAELIEALVPSASEAARAGARRRHVRVGAATFEGSALVDLTGVADGVELEIIDGPAPRPAVERWPEAGLAAEPPPGPITVHRPPRPALPPRPVPVVLPEPPAPAGRRAPVLGLATLGPLLGAGLLVAVSGDARFALLAALSPLSGAFAALDQRRRSRGESRAEHRRFQRELAEAGRALGAAADAHVRHLEELAPPVERAVRRGGWDRGFLWRRRPADPAFPDHLVLRLGTGEVRWDPPVVQPARTSPEVRDALDTASLLPSAPVTVDLGRGGVLGVVGHRPAVLALVRSLVVQAAVHHGPADLRLAVCAREGDVDRWDWVKWLPHVRAHGTRVRGCRLLATGSAARQLLHELAVARDEAGGAPADLLLVLDDPALAAGRTSAAGALLEAGGPAAATIVLASTIDELPATATEVVEVGPAGARLVHPGAGDRRAFRPDGIDDAVAASVARRLARCRDPDEGGAGDGLPRSVALVSLLGGEELTPSAVAARWREHAGRVEVPIGVGPDGPVFLDLVADGPHALVAGTTGAGKSELLRSLVVGLAATVDPTALTFVLVDYKGGAAFDACARLPHVVGLVTDLDPGLAERALRCLEAELRHRERTLRTVGCSSLDDHRAAGSPGGPLPRLVVVVDEFATMKQDVPGFVDSLVSVAQRGRSLGVHLVLATQRPGGAVSDDIRANTNLRIALRVQDPSESTDVVGGGGAARLPREVPGRALLRRGPAEVVEVQTAWSSPPGAAGRPPVRFRALRFGPGEPEPVPGATGSPAGAGLASLVDAIAVAHQQAGGAPPRRPWVDPLPAVLPVEALGDRGADGRLELGWVDVPDEQRRDLAVWRPRLGHLLVVGSQGSGRTSALVAVAHAAARGADPSACHLYALDLGGGARLAGLAALPHCGDVLGAADVERLVRLVRRLRSALDRRQDGRSTLVLVDGLPALLAALPEVGPGGAADFVRVLADGAAAGVHVAATVDRPGALPSAVAAHLPQRLALHLADPVDAAALGAVVARAPRPVPGRAVDVASGLLLQLAWAADADVESLAAALRARHGGTPPGAAGPVAVLPQVVPLAEVVGASAPAPGGLRLSVGRRDDDLGPAALEVRDGEHVLVAGPSRAGTSTALAAIASAGLVAGAEVLVVAGTRSGLRGLLPADARAFARDELVSAVELTGGRQGPLLLVVDDAHDVDDRGGELARVVADPPPGVVVVAGGRADLLRTAYGHWSRAVRRSRLGILLQPTPELDGELLGVRLPRSGASAVPGRGVLVEAGSASIVQVAVPEHA